MKAAGRGVGKGGSGRGFGPQVPEVISLELERTPSRSDKIEQMNELIPAAEFAGRFPFRGLVQGGHVSVRLEHLGEDPP